MKGWGGFVWLRRAINDSIFGSLQRHFSFCEIEENFFNQFENYQLQKSESITWSKRAMNYCKTLFLPYCLQVWCNIMQTNLCSVMTGRSLSADELINVLQRQLSRLYNSVTCLWCGPGSSVGIAIDYWLDGPGSNPGGDENIRPSRPTLGPAQPPVKMGTTSLPGVKCGRGVLLTTHPLLLPRSWKNRAIPLPTLWATPGL